MNKNTSTDPLIGKDLDGYHIMEVLGRGGMGIVYKAEDTALSRIVALKLIDPALARDEAFVRRFRAEARALARIDSQYIVGVHAMRQIEAGVFIVMEYVEGGTVSDLARKGAMPWQQALPIIKQTLTALEHAHSVQVTHRDIKPSNIMLDREGRVKVADFGLAKLHTGNAEATVTKGIAGTLYYMSPEQVQGVLDLDHRSDLYSMGMTAYQMLAGQLPVDERSGEFAIMRAIVEETFPPLSRFKSDVPQELVQVIAKSIEKDPARRYQSAREMREALEAIPLVAGKTPVAKSSKPPKPPFSPKPLMIPGVAALVVLLAALAYLMWPSAPAPGILSINTNPSGAIVYLGTEKLGETPLSNHRLDPDQTSLRLTLAKEQYQSLDTTLQIQAGDTLDVTFMLKPAEVTALVEAMVQVQTTPAQAEVLINGISQGLSDATGRQAAVQVDTGQVVVEVRKDGFKPWRQTYRASAGAALQVVAELQPEQRTTPQTQTNPPQTQTNPPPATVSLTVNVEPGGSRVQVAGEACEVGKACTVSAGRKSLTITHPTYGTFREQVTLTAGSPQTLTYYLERAVVVQVRTAAGTPIWASILVDGKEVPPPAGDKVIRLGPGDHQIAASRTGYVVQDAPQTVRVKPSFQAERPVVVFVIREQ